MAVLRHDVAINWTTVSTLEIPRLKQPLHNFYMQVTAFLNQSNITRQLCPLNWWRSNVSNYPRVSVVAKRFLSAPSTSVASERMFSGAGDIYSDSRSRLSPE